MAEYYNINYENDEIDKLDKLARELNNKKTSLCRKVINDYNNKEKNWKSGIDNVINSEKFSYLPMNKNFNKGLYNDTTTVETYDTYKTDITNKTNKTNTDYSMSDISYTSSTNFSEEDNKYFSDNYSVDSFFDNKSIDSYLNNKKNKKNVRFNKIIESINYDECSKNDKNIFEHIKKCYNCKNKLINFLNNNDNNKNKCKYSKNKNTYNNLYKKYNIKEIIIFIMIGIFIIIMLDILLRYKTY